MYCPRCGQQASEEVRFCSRCGLPLDGAAALVEAGGRLAPHDDPHEHAGELTPRQRGARKGLMIAAGGVLFFVLSLFLMWIKEDFFVFLLVAAVVFTVGVMRGLYGLLLEDDSARRKSPKLEDADERERARAKPGTRSAAELPPARTRPASDFAKKAADTADMAAPPSVTEATTKLLEEDA
jgi:hypothetical protein